MGQGLGTLKSTWGLSMQFTNANWLVCFISVYGQGLSSAQAVWVNRKYHGHHTLPPELVAEVWQAVTE
jgi:hypothetical protein